jgi:hypothetical protein
MSELCFKINKKGIVTECLSQLIEGDLSVLVNKHLSEQNLPIVFTDLISKYLRGYQSLDSIAENTKSNWTDYSIGLNASVNSLPEKQAGTFISNTGLSFLDGLNIIWDTATTLMNIAIAPLTLFFNFRMPVFIGLMIGIPYFIILFLSVIALIRGVGD